MTIKVSFYVDSDPQRTEQIIGVLKGFELETKLAQEVNRSIGSAAPHEIVSTMFVADEEAPRALDIWNSINMIPGIIRVVPMYKRVEDKIPFYKRRIIPMFISAGITFILIYGAIQKFVPDATVWDVFLFAGIPTLVTFWSQVLFKYYKN